MDARLLCKRCDADAQRGVCELCKLDFKHGRSHKPVHPRLALCFQCEADYDQFGDAANCVFCKLPTAFDGEACRQCVRAKGLYGQPTTCEGCGSLAAFPKPADKLEKVDGKTFCLVCTRDYKVSQRKERRDAKRRKMSNWFDGVAPTQKAAVAAANAASPATPVPAAEEKSEADAGGVTEAVAEEEEEENPKVTYWRERAEAAEASIALLTRERDEAVRKADALLLLQHRSRKAKTSP